MSESNDITREEAYVKYPFLKKLDKEDMAHLMTAVMMTILIGPKTHDSLMHALKAVLI